MAAEIVLPEFKPLSDVKISENEEQEEAMRNNPVGEPGIILLLPSLRSSLQYSFTIFSFTIVQSIGSVCFPFSPSPAPRQGATEVNR